MDISAVVVTDVLATAVADVAATTAVVDAVVVVVEPATPTLPPSLQKAVSDLSGAVHGGADLIRHVPVLAAAAQTTGLHGAEKQALVIQAGHAAIDLYVPEGERATAHQLVDGVFPATIRAILDVSQGRVAIGAALQAAAVEVVSSPQAQAAAAGILSQCLACFAAWRAQPAAAAAQPAAK